jgi:hypothetical protein
MRFVPSANGDDCMTLKIESVAFASGAKFRGVILAKAQMNLRRSHGLVFQLTQKVLPLL